MDEPVYLPSQSRLQAVRSLLFGSPSGHAWAVVDPDFCPQVTAMIEQHGVEHAALHGRHFAPDLLRRSPCLVALEPLMPFSEWLLSGWGRSWAIYAVSRAPLDTLREHFRSLLMVLSPSGTPLFFRFYDPRVFGVYLPTVNEQEADGVFGPVDSYVFEEEDTHAVLRFSQRKKLLKMDRIDLTAGIGVQGPAPRTALSTTDDGPRTTD
ncbi:MAG: DUF4123 domain-containing protein [Tepidisphaerales bacterium]